MTVMMAHHCQVPASMVISKNQNHSLCGCGVRRLLCLPDPRFSTDDMKSFSSEILCLVVTECDLHDISFVGFTLVCEHNCGLFLNTLLSFIVTEL